MLIGIAGDTREGDLGTGIGPFQEVIYSYDTRLRSKLCESARTESMGREELRLPLPIPGIIGNRLYVIVKV